VRVPEEWSGGVREGGGTVILFLSHLDILHLLIFYLSFECALLCLSLQYSQLLQSSP